LLNIGDNSFVVDWTVYGTITTSGSVIHVETPGAMGGGSAGDTAVADVIVNFGESFQDAITPRVHIDLNGATSSTWTDAVYTAASGGTTDTVRMDAGAYLRIGAWDALPNSVPGRLLVRYLWNGVDDSTASGYASDVYDGGIKLARVHQMASGCYHMVAIFRPSNGSGNATLNVPMKVGPSCLDTLHVSVTGTGTVTVSPPGTVVSTNAVMTQAVGTSVTLTASPASDYIFEGWSGGTCSGFNLTCGFTLNANANVTASFAPQVFFVADWSKYILRPSITCTWTASVTGGDPSVPYHYVWWSTGGTARDTTSWLSSDSYTRSTGTTSFGVGLTVTRGTGNSYYDSQEFVLSSGAKPRCGN